MSSGEKVDDFPGKEPDLSHLDLVELLAFSHPIHGR
jgi:hypothetical protein